MNCLRISLVATSLILLLASATSAQSTLKFYELMRDPGAYNGKTVKVRATWIYGFEWSYLHCLSCDGRAWLDSSALDEQSEKVLKHMPKGGGIVNVDVEGVFQTGRTFGHLNGYKFQVTAHTIANPAVISTGMKAHERSLK